MAHMMAVIQPFALCLLFILSGVACLSNGRTLAGFRLAGVGFFIMAFGEPFLGVARIDPNWVEMGNYVQGTTMPVGASVVLLGLLLVGPRRR